MKLLHLLSHAASAMAMTYSLSAYAPGTEVDGAVLNAAGHAFYTGISGPATYCPMNDASCPVVGGTLVYDGLTAMAVMVPGGQQVYVAPTGEVQYTTAHSAYMPLGALVGGWFNQTIVWDCATPSVQALNFLAPDGSGCGGVTLCPDVADFMDGTGASYQLYAKTRAFGITDCIDLVGLTMHVSDADFGCWQYI